MAGTSSAVLSDRREAILDVAERLIRTVGYERTSIQAIQDELGISRGAVYHYFGSKEDLLEAVVERMAGAIGQALQPILDDADLSADEKLRRVFLVAGRWKTERRDLVLELLGVWMSDANAVARVKLSRTAIDHILPVLVTIVRQGVEEGVFAVDSAPHTARVLMDVLQGAGEMTGELLVAHRSGAIAMGAVRETFDAYETAVERILGLPSGSFTYIDDQLLHAWFTRTPGSKGAS
ncbi:MAG TPA: TetR/AcrR family transcriptional regulator [Anaerolineae bacterium]|jgi:AcrR family transcriptional regulator|nr:TetR/AcrR family transcriptional regulator [Anaerolineae bacterium]